MSSDRTPARRRRRAPPAPSPIPSCASTMPASSRGPTSTRAFARLNQPGTYATSIARPRLFRDYLVEQLEHLSRDYDVDDLGRPLGERNPLRLCDREQRRSEVGDIGTAELSRFFPSTELAHIGDEIADGAWISAPDQPRPLALFDGPRTDFSLARLQALHRHAGRALPALRPVHQLRPLCRRVRPLVAIDAAAARGLPLHGAVGARRASTSTGELTDAEAADRRRPAGAGTRCRPTI